MTYAKPVTDSSFQSDVIESDKPVLVDFWATWCGPCRMVAPVVEELAGEYEHDLTVAKLDVDVNGETAMKYQVQAIPTLILFKDGKPAERIVGFRNKARLVADLKKHLSFIA